jgi:hypothetical protein
MKIYKGIWRYKELRQKINPKIYISNFDTLITELPTSNQTIDVPLVTIHISGNLEITRSFTIIDTEIIKNDLQLSIQRYPKKDELLYSLSAIGIELSKVISKYKFYLTQRYSDTIALHCFDLSHDQIYGLIFGLQSGLNTDENLPKMIFNFSNISQDNLYLSFLFKIADRTGGKLSS